MGGNRARPRGQRASAQSLTPFAFFWREKQKNRSCAERLRLFGLARRGVVRGLMDSGAMPNVASA